MELVHLVSILTVFFVQAPLSFFPEAAECILTEKHDRRPSRSCTDEGVPVVRSGSLLGAPSTSGRV